MIGLMRLWRGELDLPDAFWNWAVIGGLIVNLTSSALFMFLIMSDRPVAAFIAGYGPSVPYNILVCVAVWRSAARWEGDPRWAELAPIVTVVGMVVLSIT